MGLLKLAEQSLIESKFTNPSQVGVFRDARSACGVMVAYSPEAHPVQPTLAIALQGRGGGHYLSHVESLQRSGGGGGVFSEGGRG